MYRILGKENLSAVNEIANKAIAYIHNINSIEDSNVLNVSVNKDDFLLLAEAYLYLYNSVLEHSIMPNNSQPKHKIEKTH